MERYKRKNLRKEKMLKRNGIQKGRKSKNVKNTR